jgi:hypothetical protein
MALAGTLEDLNFAEIVQAINQGRKTGELVVYRPSEQAKVFFASGEVMQATLTAPAPAEPIIGAEVIYRLLGWQDGEFCFERTLRSRTRLITETTDELILEGMKRLDEWERVTEEITDQNVVLRVKAGNVSDHYDELSNDARVVLRLVDARRDVSVIIRESGFDPTRALLAISELIAQEAVEKWDPAAQPTGYGAL